MADMGVPFFCCFCVVLTSFYCNYMYCCEFFLCLLSVFVLALLQYNLNIRVYLRAICPS